MFLMILGDLMGYWDKLKGYINGVNESALLGHCHESSYK